MGASCPEQNEQDLYGGYLGIMEKKRKLPAKSTPAKFAPEETSRTEASGSREPENRYEHTWLVSCSPCKSSLGLAEQQLIASRERYQHGGQLQESVDE